MSASDQFCSYLVVCILQSQGGDVMLRRETAATSWMLVRVVSLVSPRPIRTIQLCARTRCVWMLRRAAYHETPTEHDMARSVM